MRIRMKTMGAGPAGIWRPGEVLDLEAVTAEALVAGGYADAIDPPVASAPADEVEESTNVPEAERATAPLARNRGRRQ